MHTLATYNGAIRNLSGELVITFAVDENVDIEALNALHGKELAIDIQPFKKKRSLDANAYFWKLCDEIAKVVGSDKDTIYMMMLRRYGVFETVEVIKDAVPSIERLFRDVEIVDSYDVYEANADGEYIQMTMCVLHCYRGSHDYDTQEMSDLINGTVSDAEELRIPTLTPKELNKITSNWRTK